MGFHYGAETMSANTGILGNNWKSGSLALVAIGAVWVGAHTIFGGEGVYKCEDLIPEVVQLSKDNPAPLTNVTILDISEPRTTTPGTAKSVKCAGKAFLSDGSEQDITYRVFEKNGKPWLFFEPIEN